MRTPTVSRPEGVPEGLVVDYPHVPLMLSPKMVFHDFRAVILQSALDPRPNEVDDKIALVCQTYAASESGARESLRKLVSNGFSLLHFAWRMANRALRTRSWDAVWLALMALSLEDQRSDYRETIAALAMLRYAAKAAGFAWKEMFAQAAKLSSPRTADYIERFRQHEPEEDPLESYLVRVVVGAHGPEFHLPS